MNTNKSETARMNNTSIQTVSRLLDKNKDEVETKVTQKEEENTKDMLEYMDKTLNDQKKVIELCLNALQIKLAKPDMFTNVRDIATVYGIIYDKALKFKELSVRQQEIKQEKSNIEEINKGINNISELINNPTKVRDENSIDE
jgi:glucan-binding YG repeat protein